MTCEQVEQLAADYLDGALPQRTAAEVQAHTRDCQRCRLLIQELRATVQVCRSVPSPEFPETEWLLRRGQTVRAAVRSFRIRSFAATLASAAVIVVGIIGARTAMDRGGPAATWEAALSPDAIVEAVDYLSSDGEFPLSRLAHP